MMMIPIDPADRPFAYALCLLTWIIMGLMAYGAGQYVLRPMLDVAGRWVVWLG